MSLISERLQVITAAIHEAEAAAHRRRNAVTLLAVSKKQSAGAILNAYEAGMRHFGESYLQEALPKMKTLSHLPIIWHFIGPIQSNKAKTIAADFSWVHSLSRIKIADYLNAERSEALPPLNVCLQINFDDENKSGVHPDDVPDLLQHVLHLPRLKLRGLMMIPKPTQDEQQQSAGFLNLAHLLESLNRRYNLAMDTLSMGMSNDYKAAICAGSTIVRIGTALFGERI